MLLVPATENPRSYDVAFEKEGKHAGGPVSFDSFFLLLLSFLIHIPVAYWLALLTLMQEVRGSNPGAAPPTFGQFGAQNPSPYPS